MLLADLDFDLPSELIAQTPANPRESARLLRLKRATGQTSHLTMREFPELLRPTDLLVFNDTRVLRARLLGHKSSGGRVEALLLEEMRRNIWRALLKPSARLQVGAEISFGEQQAVVKARLLERDGPQWTIEFQCEGDARDLLPQIGHVPLPPYIHASADDNEEDYQTTYARTDPHIEGHAFDSAAAPTAGLHFSPQLLEHIEARGIERAFVTLAVGTGTFAPIKVENLNDHPMHAERFHIAPEVAAKINAHRANGGRVVAVGTTTVRTLESAVNEQGSVRGGWGETRLFLRPGAHFRVIDALLTNFHLPRSTLLALVAAFVEDVPQEMNDANGENGSISRGLTLVRAAYREAISDRYRFFSWGDAMFIE